MTEAVIIKLISTTLAITMDRIYRKDHTPLTEDEIRAEAAKLKALKDLPTDEPST